MDPIAPTDSITVNLETNGVTTNILRDNDLETPSLGPTRRPSIITLNPLTVQTPNPKIKLRAPPQLDMAT